MADIINYNPNTGAKLSKGESVVDKSTGKTVTQGSVFGSSSGGGGSSSSSGGGSTSTTTLKVGSSGSAVTNLQTQLKNAGYTVAVDGKFGPETEKAVKAYQAANGLTVDGLAGTKTQSALKSGTTTNNNATAKVVAGGDPDIRAIQEGLNAEGANITEDGLWGPETSNAYNKVWANNTKTNLQSSSEDIINAYLNNDWTNIRDNAGMPFSPSDQQEAYDKSMEALNPYYEELKAKDQADTESALKKKQLDYQNQLASSKIDFETDKTTQDQTAANQGVLFSGGRVQKLQTLGDTYTRNQSNLKQQTALSMGDTARNYQYEYGNNAAGNLSNYYKLGSNSYNPNVAQGGVTSNGLSSIYNPSNYDFQGRTVNAQKAEAQKRAAGLLWNKGNKLMSTGLSNSYK